MEHLQQEPIVYANGHVDNEIRLEAEQLIAANDVEKSEEHPGSLPRKRGRPRKYPLPPPHKPEEIIAKRPRGRPKGSGKHQRAAAAAAAAVAGGVSGSLSASVDSGYVGNTAANHYGANSYPVGAAGFKYENANGQTYPTSSAAIATPNLPATVSPPLFETPSTRSKKNRRKKATPTKAA